MKQEFIKEFTICDGITAKKGKAGDVYVFSGKHVLFYVPTIQLNAFIEFLR